MGNQQVVSKVVTYGSTLLTKHKTLSTKMDNTIDKVILDPEFEYLRSLLRPNLNKGAYAMVSASHNDGCNQIFLHHCIAGQPIKRQFDVVDHINTNTLDNRACNLRVTNRRTNSLNCNKRSNKKKEVICKYKGYTYDSKKCVFCLHCSIAPYFSSKQEVTVARVYEYFATLNCPSYPRLLPLLTEEEVKFLYAKKTNKSPDPLKSIAMAYETKMVRGKNNGLLRYRLDVHRIINGEKVKDRKRLFFISEQSATNYGISLTRELNRDKLYIRLKDTTSTTIEIANLG